MAKNSILVGTVTQSSFKNKGTESTQPTVKNGEPGRQGRTHSSRAQNEVTYVNVRNQPKRSK